MEARVAREIGLQFRSVCAQFETARRAKIYSSGEKITFLICRQFKSLSILMSFF